MFIKALILLLPIIYYNTSVVKRIFLNSDYIFSKLNNISVNDICLLSIFSYKSFNFTTSYNLSSQFFFFYSIVFSIRVFKKLLNININRFNYIFVFTFSKFIIFNSFFWQTTNDRTNYTFISFIEYF